jgi:hypothetical protein
MNVTMANELKTTRSTLEEVHHMDLVFEPGRGRKSSISSIEEQGDNAGRW